MTKTWILIALALLLVQGCSLEEDISKLKTPSWEGEIAAPIAKGSVTVGEAIDQLNDVPYLEAKPDGTLVFSAEFPLSSWAIPELVEIPDFPVIFFESALNLPFPIEGLTRADLKAGTMEYDIVSSSDRPIRVEIRIRDLKYQEADAIFSVVLDGSGRFTGSFDLNEYSFQPTNGHVAMSYDAYLEDSNEPAEVDQVRLDFSGIETSYLEGRLPEISLDLDPDTINFQTDLGIDFSQLSLTEPALELIIESQAGVPNSFSFPFFGILDGDQQTHALVYSPFEEGSSLALAPSPDVWAETSFRIDPSNSNIHDLLDLGVPQGLIYQANLLVFPEAQPGNGFITDQDSIRVRVETEVALVFQLGETEFSQDIDLDIETIDLIRSGSVLLITDNGLPLDLDLQVYLLDDQAQVMDSLFVGHQPILRGAEVDTDGYTTGHTGQRTELSFDEETLTDLDEASGLRLSARVSSTGNGSQAVRITRDQALGFQIGVRAQP